MRVLLHSFQRPGSLTPSRCWRYDPGPNHAPAEQGESLRLITGRHKYFNNDMTHTPPYMQAQALIKGYWSTDITLHPSNHSSSRRAESQQKMLLGGIWDFTECARKYETRKFFLLYVLIAELCNGAQQIVRGWIVSEIMYRTKKYILFFKKLEYM